VPQAFVDLTISLPFNDADLVRKSFAQNKGQIAAVIVEPVPANAGLYFPTSDFLPTLRKECTRNGALLIFDEVITGFRVARGGAQEIYGIKPDLTALGKIIGGGLPVGGFGGRADIMDQLSPDGSVYQAGTLSGNPLAMAAGLAQLRELERINGWKLLEGLGAQFESLALDAIKYAKIHITFHRLGSMFCLFFVPGPIVDLTGARRSDLKMFTRFFHACLERGIYFAPSQFETGFISTAHSQTDIERTAAVMGEALAAL
jgi:glutamate-1-semialdehyde 2,1-aminomutase